MNAFVKSLLLLRERCNRGYQEWVILCNSFTSTSPSPVVLIIFFSFPFFLSYPKEPIYDYMNIFLYKMYSVKMNQEEEAPMGK